MFLVVRELRWLELEHTLKTVWEMAVKNYIFPVNVSSQRANEDSPTFFKYLEGGRGGGAVIESTLTECLAISCGS